MAANTARQDGNRATAPAGTTGGNPSRAQRAPRSLFSMAFAAQAPPADDVLAVEAGADVDSDTADEPLLVIDLRDDDPTVDLTNDGTNGLTYRTIPDRDEAAADDLRLRRAMLAARAAEVRRLIDAELDGADTLTRAEPAILIDEVLPSDAGLVAKMCALDQLRRDGLISEADYQAKAAQLLGRS